MTVTNAAHETTAQANAAPQSTAEPSIQKFDPRDLKAHRANRQDLGSDEELASMAETINGSPAGLIQFPVVIPVGDGSHRILAGHRRVAAIILAYDNRVSLFEKAAAAHAEGADWRAVYPADQRPADTVSAPVEPADPEVLCVVRPDLAGLEPEQLVAILNENGQRLGLSATQEAQLYHQLTLDHGWNLDKITRATGRKSDYITAQLAIAGLPATVAKARQDGVLSLEDSAALDEFRDEPKIVEKLLKKANQTYGIKHAIDEERRKRDARTAAAERIESLRAAGVDIITRPKGWPDCQPVDVTRLYDADDQPLDAEALAPQPGFAAFTTSINGFPQVVIACLNPAKHGYHRKDATGLSAAEIADREQRAAERAAWLEALNAHQAIRWSFITETYGSAKGAKKVFQPALRVAAARPTQLRVEGQMVEELDQLAGCKIGQVADTAGMDRLTRIMVARWVGFQEYAARYAPGSTWYYGIAVAWFDQLVSDGYTLSDAEQALYDQMADHLSAQAAKEADAQAAEAAAAHLGEEQEDDEAKESDEE